MKDHRVVAALNYEHLPVTEQPTLIAGQAKTLFDHRHRLTLRTDDALCDREMIVATFNDPDPLWKRRINH